MTIVVVWTTIKVWVVVKCLPAMTVWLDELLYFTTAFDLGHPDGFGVPHPGFLYYPPLTSLVTAPVHWLPVSASWHYRLSLVVLICIVGSTLIAAERLHRELFGESSAGAVLLVALAAPAYLGYSLMSEPLFVTAYSWYLVFLARHLRSGSKASAAAAAASAVAMVLTRATGVGLALAALSGVILDATERQRFNQPRSPTRELAGLLLGVVPIAGYATWSFFRSGISGSGHATPSISGYLQRSLESLQSVPADLAAIATRLGANIAYVSFSTGALGLVAAFWYLMARRFRLDPAHLIGRRITLEVLVFMLFAAGIAAVHMFLYRDRQVPKYDMYGRYMDYFSVPLLVLIAGVTRQLARCSSPRSARLRFSMAVPTTALVSWLLIPSSFWSRIAEGRVGPSPNHNGIGWLLACDWQQSRLLVLAIGVPTLAAAVFAVPASARQARRLLITALAILFVVNASVVAVFIAKRSEAAFGRYRSYSDFVSDNPRAFESGLVLDSSIWSHPAAHLYAHLYVDHLSLVRADTELSAYLGRLPIVTSRQLEHLPVLHPDPNDPRYRLLRIYGANWQESGGR